MIEIRERQLRSAYRGDDDFVFLRVALAGDSNGRAVLSRWYESLRPALKRLARIGAPIAMRGEAWAIDVEGAETFENLLLIVDDLATTLSEAGCIGEITRQPTRHSPLDDPLGSFALTTVAASPVLRVDADERAEGRGYYNRGDVDPAAAAEALAHALEWCSRIDGALHVGIDVLSVEVTPGELERLLSAALRNPMRAVEVTGSRWPDVARRVTFTRDGHVLYCFGRASGRGDARDTAASIHELFGEIAPWVDYACAVQAFEASPSYPQLFNVHWPPLPALPVYLVPLIRGLESRRIPDAFFMQLLGEGHHAADLQLDGYDLSRLPGGRVALRHRDADRWLGEAVPPPLDVIDDGRRELAPLIVSGEDVAELRRVWGPGVP